MIRWFVVGALVLAGGCLKANVNRCDNGAICPLDQACTERLTPVLCGDPADVAACFGMAAHTACPHAAAGGVAGSCSDNLCSDCNANWVECRYAAWTAMDSGTSSKINALQVFSANDAYAAADGRMLHYDGLEWTTLAAPTGSIFYDLWGATGSDLFIVDGNSEVYRNGAIEPTPPPIPQKSLWGSSADDVFAAGQTIIGHRSSAGWAWSSAAPLGTKYESVSGVAGTVVVAGSNASGAMLWTTAATSTTPFAPAMPSPAANYVPKAVWGTSMSDFFVVGVIANSDPFVYRFNAGAWSAMTLPTEARELFGVWGRTSSDVYAVGDAGTIVHFDGTSWTSMTPPNALVDLKAIDGHDGDLLVAGSTGAIWKLSEL